MNDYDYYMKAGNNALNNNQYAAAWDAFLAARKWAKLNSQEIKYHEVNDKVHETALSFLIRQGNQQMTKGAFTQALETFEYAKTKMEGYDFKRSTKVLDLSRKIFTGISDVRQFRPTAADYKKALKAFDKGDYSTVKLLCESLKNRLKGHYLAERLLNKIGIVDKGYNNYINEGTTHYKREEYDLAHKAFKAAYEISPSKKLEKVLKRCMQLHTYQKYIVTDESAKIAKIKTLTLPLFQLGNMQDFFDIKLSDVIPQVTKQVPKQDFDDLAEKIKQAIQQKIPTFKPEDYVFNYDFNIHITKSSSVRDHIDVNHIDVIDDGDKTGDELEED